MVFIIVPFMELLLPVALTLFPNMLPSTFTDTLQKEEKLKKELQMRIAIAGFFQETMQTIAHEKGEKMLLPDDTAGATAVISFFEKVRLGEELPNDVVIKMAR
jgi:LETM1 and EF-hand domain-containing protein 1, mitochondrial